MSKIHEIINKSSNDDLLDNEKNLSYDEKQRILNMTLNKIPTKKSSVVNKKKLVIGLLVATMMISTIAMAKEYISSNLDNDFLNLFGINKDDTRLDPAGEYVNKTTSDNGLDVTVRQTLGDEHTIHIILDVVAPNNVKIPQYAHFNDAYINLAKDGSAGWGFEYLDDDFNDNKASYLISYNTEVKLTNKNNISLSFEDFGYYSDDNDEFVPLIKGKWSLSWDLKYENLTKTIKVNHFVKENKYMSIITSIKVSPLSISANLIGMSYDNFYISKITMKDGTVYDANEFNGSASSSFLKGYTSVEFNKVIDVDNIKSITIGNEVFEINK